MLQLGIHYIVEFYECDPNILNNLNKIREILHMAAIKSNATIIDENYHKFEPHGVSGIIIIAESHISIHTWPEYKYAAVDIYTCGYEMEPSKAVDYIKEHIKSLSFNLLCISRGIYE